MLTTNSPVFSKSQRFARAVAAVLYLHPQNPSCSSRLSGPEVSVCFQSQGLPLPPDSDKPHLYTIPSGLAYSLPRLFEYMYSLLEPVPGWQRSYNIAALTSALLIHGITGVCPLCSPKDLEMGEIKLPLRQFPAPWTLQTFSGSSNTVSLTLSIHTQKPEPTNSGFEV